MNAQLREALAALTNEAKRANKTALREFGVGLIEVNVIARADAALSAPAEQARQTGYVAPVGKYVLPVLFSPYTGDPRDARDIATDPQGILIVPPGAAMLAAAPSAPTAVQPADESMEDPVLVPRGLLGAACSAIDKKRDAPTILAKLRAITMSAAARAAPTAVQPATPVPEGMVLAPHYRGYARLGVGAYLINHSAQGEPAELIISIASEEDKEGRTVGDLRDNPEGRAIQPEEMAVRIRFENVAGLDALEQQLRLLRKAHFAASISEQPADWRHAAAQFLRARAEERSSLGLPTRADELWGAADLLDQLAMAAPYGLDCIAPTVVAPSDLRERLAEAHDASLDDDHKACRGILTEAMRLLDATPVTSKTLEALTDVDAFLGEVRAELVRARTKFPGDRIMTIALAEEFGELCKAVLDESAANVRKEAVQTAVMAARVVLDGDGSVREWRAERGLDALATKNNMTLGGGDE